MKKLIIIISILVSWLLPCQAQDYVQKGHIYYEVSADTVKFTEVETDGIWVEKNGEKYVIFLSKNGRAYIKKWSKRTNKEYKKYLPEQISRALCKKFNVKYIETPAKL